MKMGLVALAIFGVLGLIGFQVYSSTYNMANSYEQQIDNLQKKSKSTLSNYATQMVEIAQVPNKYKSDLIDVIKATMSGRYGNHSVGEDGKENSPVMQFIKEQNLQLDSKLYLNLQNSMVAGRREFKIS